MLSYRHSFHAGNFADIIKHIVLVDILEHLLQKNAPFDYIDTHSGAGLFNLDSADALKLEEHTNGIGKVDLAAFPELTQYFEVLHAYNDSDIIKVYPGSPAIASYLLRRQDRAWLYELHPQDYAALCNNMANNKRIRVGCEDGLKALAGLLPPASRRALVLIDPAYELKTEYDQVFNALLKAYKKFATGIYAIWYPVVDRSKIDFFEKRLIDSGIKNIQRFELGLSRDMNGRGMTSSGMFVINPPWTLFSKMSALLPRLAQTLAVDNEQIFKCDIIAAE